MKAIQLQKNAKRNEEPSNRMLSWCAYGVFVLFLGVLFIFFPEVFTK